MDWGRTHSDESSIIVLLFIYCDDDDLTLFLHLRNRVAVIMMTLLVSRFSDPSISTNLYHDPVPIPDTSHYDNNIILFSVDDPTIIFIQRFHSKIPFEDSI